MATANITRDEAAARSEVIRAEAGLSDRLHLVRARGETDLLWATEEALRSAEVAMVLAEPEKPLR